MDWRCEECGRQYAENDPPCFDCGHDSYEPVPEESGEPSDPVWVCPECGRQHQKNTPPCSRCGNVHLEKRLPDYTDLDELGGTSYRDVLELRYVAGFLVAGLFGTLLVLGATGVVDVPGFGPPSVSDPPGDAERLGNLSLSTVEDEYVAALNERRAAAGVGELTRGGGLDAMATFYNQRRLVAELEEGRTIEPEDVVDQLREFDTGCRSGVGFTTDDAPSGTAGGDAAAVASSLVDRSGGAIATDGAVDRVGVDVHARPDGGIAVTVLRC